MPQDKDRGGRPPVGPRFDVRLPADLLRQLDEWRTKEGMTRAQAVRHMVADFLTRQRRKNRRTSR